MGDTRLGNQCQKLVCTRNKHPKERSPIRCHKVSDGLPHINVHRWTFVVQVSWACVIPVNLSLVSVCLFSLLFFAVFYPSGGWI